MTTHTLACIMHRKSKEIECVLDWFLDPGMSKLGSILVGKP